MPVKISDIKNIIKELDLDNELEHIIEYIDKAKRKINSVEDNDLQGNLDFSFDMTVIKALNENLFNYINDNLDPNIEDDNIDRKTIN